MIPNDELHTPHVIGLALNVDAWSGHYGKG